MSSWALPEERTRAQEELLAWYQVNRRSFPWRETTDPYAILVSEVMSQQTQLERVESAWTAFLDRWPTVEDLAAADRSAVVGFWTEQRLGYNNRARYLHEAAQTVLEEFDGAVPEDPETLETLQGVGPYTANAVASFAFNTGGPVIDTNVKRVFYRAFAVPDEQAAFKTATETMLPAGRSRDWNNAVMELGGVVCQQTPRCDEKHCPWREWCQAYQTGDFTAPDVPEQPTFEGSRRQFRGRIIRLLNEYQALSIDRLGPRVRVDFDPTDADDQAWLQGILTDLAADGLIELTEDDGTTTARLKE